MKQCCDQQSCSLTGRKWDSHFVPHPSSLGYCAAVSTKLRCHGRHAIVTAHNHTSTSSSVAKPTEIEKEERSQRGDEKACACSGVYTCVCVERNLKPEKEKEQCAETTLKLAFQAIS